MAVISPEITMRLREAQAGGGKRLNLMRCELTAVPEAVFALSRLEEINLSHNRLRRIPERLRNLFWLRRVDLYNNPIEHLPDLSGLGIDLSTYFACRSQLDKASISGLEIRADHL